MIRLDAEIAVLVRRRQTAAARIQARPAGFPPPRTRPAPAHASPPTRDEPERPPARRPEASTKLVQNVLFLLGGLLLSVAAIVFTAVAWSQFGVGGRSAILAVFTLAALAAPLPALRRGLTATAETFAAVGLLLVLLDGYAAWYVNLFGVADFAPYGYAGAVCAVTAAVAAGYEHLTGLTGPRFAALVVAQPVVPLLTQPLDLGPAGWAFRLAGVAALNLVVLYLRPARLTLAAYSFGAVAAAAGGLMALEELMSAAAIGSIALAGAALVAVAGIVLAGAVLSRVTVAREIAAGMFVVALALAAGRVAYVQAAVLMASAVALIAGAASLAAGRRHNRDAGVALLGRSRGGLLHAGAEPLSGARIGALAALGAALLVLGARGIDGQDWQLPVGILLLIAGTLAVWRVREVPVVGLTLVVLTAPAGFGWVWWSAPIAYLPAAGVVLALVVRSVVRPWTALAAVVPAGLAVAIAARTPEAGAATLGGLVALGVGMAITAWRTPRRADVGGLSLTVALLAVPGAAAWAIADDVWQARVGLAVTGLVVGAVHRSPRAYRGFAVAGALPLLATAPLWALSNGEPIAVYAATALLLLATLPGRVSLIAAVPLGVVAIAGLAGGVGWTLIAAATGGPATRTGWPDVAAVLLLTAAAVVAAAFAQIRFVWTGTTKVVGVKVGGSATEAAKPSRARLGNARAGAAQAGTTEAGAAEGLRRPGWVAAPGVVLVVPMGAAAAHAPWPWVPSFALAAGLLALIAAALSSRPRVVAAVGLVIGGFGLAGLSLTYAATLSGLGAVLIAAAIVGAAGRTLAARLTGWPVAVTAAVAFAITASRAAELPLRTTAFVVLAVAAVALLVGTIMAKPLAGATSGRIEGRVLQAAAHSAAVVALLLTVGSPGYAAAVCTLWGIALGLRALVPGERAAVLVVAAATTELGAWWLLLTAQRVAVLEAYTIPAAAVALLAGWLALRSKAGLSSWVSVGPALAAALLPTLASVLVDEGQPIRRLALGLGALAVVLAGSQARLQAPVVTGGAVLTVVALHEVVLVWDLLPRWIPLAAAGLLLVGLAMTLERRRRDLSRMRAALTRMT